MKNKSLFKGLVLIASLLFCISSVTANTNEVTVIVRKIKARSKDAGNGKMDFYVKVRINRANWQKSKVKEGNNISPGWTYRGAIGSTTRVPVTVEVWDEDGFGAGGGDDPVDVSKYSTKAIHVHLDTRTQKVYDEKNKYIGRFGKDITFTGDSYRKSIRKGSNLETGQVVLRFEARVNTKKTMTLSINNLYAKSKDACGQMNFYAKTTISRGRTRTTAQKEGNRIRPNWRHSEKVSPSALTSVKVEIMDYDRGIRCGGGDDKVDVNPERNKTALLFYVDPTSKIIYRDRQKRKRVGRVGQNMTFEGYTTRTTGVLEGGDNIETGKVTLRIDLR